MRLCGGFRPISKCGMGRIPKKKRSGGIFRLRLAYRFVKLGVVNKHCVLPNYTAPEVMFIQPFLRQINCLESAESHRAD